MASSEKTTRGFSKWGEGDKPGMADFNADNQRLEEVLTEMEETVSEKLDKAQVQALIQQALKPYYSLKGDNRTRLSEGADLNDYKALGNVYVGNNNASVSTMKNVPFKGQAFVMTVEPAIKDGNYILQTVRRYSDGVTATRYYSIYNATDTLWTDWNYSK